MQKLMKKMLKHPLTETSFWVIKFKTLITEKLGLAMFTVPPCRIVLAVFTNAPTHPPTGLVHGWVKMTFVRMTVTVAP